MTKTLSVVAMAAFAAAATVASAQRYVDPAWPDRNPEWRGEQECWNPRAGHYERVRAGEIQNDLDYGNCRSVSGYGVYYGAPVYVAPTYVAPVYPDRYVGRIYTDRTYYGNTREECWNPRAGHFEEVRRGEYQNDLDFRRCRLVRY